MSVPCFELFGLPVRFEVDMEALEKAYRAAQRESHPDKVAQSDARARLIAMQRTAAINEAYKILKDPMRRAEELLRRRGIGISDEQRMSPEFLGDILDMRESLEDAKAAGDRARVGALGREIGTRQEEAMVLLRAGLENGGHDGELADAFARLKYYARFLDEVRAVEAEDD